MPLLVALFPPPVTVTVAVFGLCPKPQMQKDSNFAFPLPSVMVLPEKDPLEGPKKEVPLAAHE
jgi:hypothetical protein